MGRSHLFGESCGHLERAFDWLNSVDIYNVFYAALDLRFAFEKIHIKHGLASENNSNKFLKLTHKPKTLKNKLEQEFSEKIDLSSGYAFWINGLDDKKDSIGYYLPIPDHLYTKYGELDNYLHSQWAIPINWPDRRWQKEQTKALFSFAEELIPHANPKNSLNWISVPNVKIEKMEIKELIPLLCEYWKM